MQRFAFSQDIMPGPGGSQSQEDSSWNSSQAQSMSLLASQTVSSNPLDLPKSRLPPPDEPRKKYNIPHWGNRGLSQGAVSPYSGRVQAKRIEAENRDVKSHLDSMSKALEGLQRSQLAGLREVVDCLRHSFEEESKISRETLNSQFQSKLSSDSQTMQDKLETVEKGVKSLRAEMDEMFKSMFKALSRDEVKRAEETAGLKREFESLVARKFEEVLQSIPKQSTEANEAWMETIKNLIETFDARIGNVENAGVISKAEKMNEHEPVRDETEQSANLLTPESSADEDDFAVLCNSICFHGFQSDDFHCSTPISNHRAVSCQTSPQLDADDTILRRRFRKRRYLSIQSYLSEDEG